jgi:hypothetical protein
MKLTMTRSSTLLSLFGALLLLSGCKDSGSGPVTVVPGTPSATTPTSTSTSGFTANWQAVDNAVSYLLDVSADSLFAVFVTGYHDKNVGNVTSYNVGGLSAGTRYFYRVRAAGAGGTSGASNVVALTLPPVSVTLAAPVLSTASGASTTGFTASWSSVAGATNYRFDLSDDSTFITLVPGFSDLDVGDVTSFAPTGINSGERYFYRVRATNVSEISPNSNTMAITLGTSFSQRVLPILVANGCTGCHGGSGGLVVGSVASLLAGGDHGPAVVAFNAAGSNIIKKLTQVPPPFGSSMPLGGSALPAASVDVIRHWINEGAFDN